MRETPGTSVSKLELEINLTFRMYHSNSAAVAGAGAKSFENQGAGTKKYVQEKIVFPEKILSKKKCRKAQPCKACMF